MIRELRNKYPKDLRVQVDLTINELVDGGIFELHEHGYKITPTGEEIIYDNDYYTIDRVINKILVYFRDNNYFENSIWPRLTAMAFCNNLNAYGQRLFDPAIEKMTNNGLLGVDDIHNGYVLKKKCENVMYGLEELE